MEMVTIGPTPTTLRCYKTGLCSSDHGQFPRPPYYGRGFAFGVRYYRHDGAHPYEEIKVKVEQSIVLTFDVYERRPDGSGHWQSAPEILIYAISRTSAQIAANLLHSAMILLLTEPIVDQVVALPEDRAEFERDGPFDRSPSVRVTTGHVAEAAKLAAKLSRNRRWRYAAMKLSLSQRLMPVSWMDTHPRYDHTFGIESDPATHTTFAASIIAAYSAIEELGFEIRARADNPSMINGRWNPPIREDLEDRLRRGYIDIGDPETWLSRGAQTKIDRKRPLPIGRKASWARGQIRDREIALIDAIHRASWLRSKVSSHRLNDLTASLKVYDVLNVQMLARRLLLETTGFLWPKR